MTAPQQETVRPAAGREPFRATRPVRARRDFPVLDRAPRPYYDKAENRQMLRQMPRS